MKRFERCVLHIGTEKTGTTTIQKFMATNRDAFAREGVVYVKSAGGDGGSQWGFAACAHAKPWVSDMGMALGIRSASDQRSYRKRLGESLEREFKESPDARTLLISCEHFHSRLSTVGEIEKLKDFLLPWVDRFEVVVYLRRQDRVAVSHYSTKIKSGNADPVVFPTTANGELPYYYDYERIYENWRTAFGVESLCVRLFDRRELFEGDLLHDFCATCGLQLSEKQLPSSENESLNQAGVDFLLAVNRQLPPVIDGKRNEVRDRLAGFVSGICRGKSTPGTRDEARAFYERFTEGNDRLRQKAFASRAGSLFDEDFSDYPDTVQIRPPSHSDAVELAIRIWQSKGGPSKAVVSDVRSTAVVPNASPTPAPEIGRLKQLKADNHYLQGMLALKNAKPEIAVRQLQNALAEKPDHVRANIELARILLRRNDTDSGMRYLTAAKSACPGGNAALERLWKEYGAA